MTAAWLDLLPCAEPGDIPEWLTPIGMRVCQRLGVADVEAAVARPIVAEVLAEVRGDPGDVIEGKAICPTI